MRQITMSFAVCCLLSQSACNNDPVKDAPRAQTAAPIEKAIQAPDAEATLLPITSENSSLKFVGAKVTDKHEGAFEKLEGQIRWVDRDPTKSSVEVKIKMDSLSIEPAKLAGHLRGADFFDVEKFPEAIFESTAIAPAAAGEYRVTGNLTLHGTKKAISFPAKIKASGQGVLVEAQFGINRKDFGIVYPGMPDDLIKDEVLIQLELAAGKS